MSNKAFQQNLDDKKGPQPGGPYLIQMLFKELHLLCNEKGEIINFNLTKANVDDRNENEIGRAHV